MCSGVLSVRVCHYYYSHTLYRKPWQVTKSSVLFRMVVNRFCQPTVNVRCEVRPTQYMNSVLFLVRAWLPLILKQGGPERFYPRRDTAF